MFPPPIARYFLGFCLPPGPVDLEPRPGIASGHPDIAVRGDSKRETAADCRTPARHGARGHHWTTIRRDGRLELVGTPLGPHSTLRCMTECSPPRSFSGYPRERGKCKLRKELPRCKTAFSQSRLLFEGSRIADGLPFTSWGWKPPRPCEGQRYSREASRGGTSVRPAESPTGVENLPGEHTGR